MLTTDERIAIDAWLSQDPDHATATALTHLVELADGGDSSALAEIRDAFRERLAFGTAGLRAALGPGPNRMNRVVVAQAAAGLAEYLIDQGLRGRRVLVGYDARYNSDAFAIDTAEILAGYGLQAILTTTYVPTPVVAFGIRHFECVAGVVVTASHNPAQDNGYKVYVGGSQIVPPVDDQIAAWIDLVAARPVSSIPRSNKYETIGLPLIDAYVSRAASLVPADASRDLVWAYTPMHGVGADVVARVLDRTGFPPPALVSDQALPDPSFPTVAFPNPEEPGAMDMALDLAKSVCADVAIANDPDADRVAIAAPIDRTWRMLTGDELGCLLADDALRRGTPGVYACSIVSSTLLSEMAAAAGQRFEQTLTGFKWIGRVPGLAFGYEEAIGYCTDPAAVTDKDGITTLTRILVLVAALKASGSSIESRLNEIARTFGVHLTSQLSFRVADLSLISDAMARLRADPPTLLADEPVVVSDLSAGWRGLPPTDGVLIDGERVRVVVRPSGTEPKLKCYLQVRLNPASSTDLGAARALAASTLARVSGEMRETLGL